MATTHVQEAANIMSILWTEVTGSAVKLDSVVKSGYGWQFHSEDGGLCATCGKIHNNQPLEV